MIVKYYHNPDTVTMAVVAGSIIIWHHASGERYLLTETDVNLGPRSGRVDMVDGEHVDATSILEAIKRNEDGGPQL